MKDFEQAYEFDVWDVLKAGKEVTAVDLERREFYELIDCSVGEVVTIMKYENVVFYRRKEEQNDE